MAMALVLAEQHTFHTSPHSSSEVFVLTNSEPSVRVDARALVAAMRGEIAAMLPERAFLRRDRGDALFVTNAPAFADVNALAERLSLAGWRVRARGGLLAISPGAERIDQFERARPEPPDFLTRSLKRLCGLPVCGEALAVFAEGLRRAEHGDAEDYDRRVRQLAALCLRRSCGGAYACAVILYDLNHSPGKEL